MLLMPATQCGCLHVRALDMAENNDAGNTGNTGNTVNAGHAAHGQRGTHRAELPANSGNSYRPCFFISSYQCPRDMPASVAALRTSPPLTAHTRRT